MSGFIKDVNRSQSSLFPESLDDFVNTENAVRVIDVFIEALDLAELGFTGVITKSTGRPKYHPAVMLKLYLYGYLNRVQSSRRLETEANRNIELMWLLERLLQILKPLLTSGRIMLRVLSMFAGHSLNYADNFNCLMKVRLPLMVVN